MSYENIPVRLAASGKAQARIVHAQPVRQIEPLAGEGEHGMRCPRTPTRNGDVDRGQALGRALATRRERRKAGLATEARFRLFRRLAVGTAAGSERR